MRAIQLMETTPTAVEAEALFAALREQDSYVGGRMLPPSYKGGWHVQVLFEDDGCDGDLPEGLRRVFVPTCLYRAFGIEAAS